MPTRQPRAIAWLGLVLAAMAWTSPVPAAQASASPGQAVQSLPQNIAEQKDVLEQAFADALTELSREENGASLVKDVRGLCIGSWCANKASVSSDLDLTIDHPDKKVAARLKEMVNRRVEKAMAGKSHKIRVTYSGDPACVDCFSGTAGDSFIFEYAQRNSIGGKNTYKPVVENGVVRFEKTEVADFWRGAGKTVPIQVNRVQTFVDESARIFEMYKTGVPLDDALAAAKYLNNIEGIVKPGFSRTYGTPLPASLQLDEATKYEMRELVKIKGTIGLTAEQKNAALKRIFRLGAADDAALEGKLKSFIEKTETYFATTKEKMGLFEDVLRGGALAGAKAPAEALSLAETLFNVSKKYSGSPFAALDIGILVHHYQNHGADQAFYEQLALTGAMHGGSLTAALPAASVGGVLASALPPAALIAMLGAIEKEIVRAAGEAAVNAFIFDPINDQIVMAGYDPSNEFSLFTAEFSPFRGLSRETLACKYLGNRLSTGDPMARELEPLLVEDIDTYVSNLPRSSRMMFADIGPADIRNRFLPHLMANLETSRRLWRAIGMRETALYAAATLMFPPSPALQVWANGEPLPQRSNRAFHYDAPIGKDVSLTISVTREFARQISRKVPAPGVMQKQWCAVQGDWAAYLKWERAALAEQTTFESSPSPVHVGTAVTNAAGWRVSTTLPGATNLSTGSGSGEANVLGGSKASDGGQSQFATAEYRVSAAPTEQAKAPATIAIGFRLRGGVLIESLDESYALSLIVTPVPVALPPTPPVAPTPKVAPPPAKPGGAAPPAPPTASSPQTTGSGNPARDACVKAARQELESGRQEFERWKRDLRGKTPAPFVCTTGSTWWPCLPDDFAKVWKAVDGAVPLDKWGHNTVPECLAGWAKGTNTSYNECAWPVYLGKLEVLANRKIAECEKR